MGRRILNRKDLRADYDAAEARRKQDDEETDTDTDDEEEDDDEESGEADDADAEEREEGDEDEEEVPVKKKKVVKEAKPKRTRTAKVVRMKVVWVVYNNSNQKVADFDYPKKKEAEEHAAKLKTDKNQTFFVQPVKVPIE
jgi:hypothetical protein